MPNRLLLPRPQAVAADGRPLAGAKLYTYTTGTSTPKSVYTTAALNVAHANPVVADSAGRWPSMFLAADEYRIVLKDADDVTIFTDDNVTGLEAAAGSSAGTIPVGALMPYAGSSAPTGWLLCYGQTVSRTTYADLFAVLGTTYGAGDGSTFGIPDLRGRAVFGKDNMGGSTAGRVTNAGSAITGTTLGAAGGNEALQQHSHSVTDPGHTHTGTTASDGAHTHDATFRGTSAANQSGGLGNNIGEETEATTSAGTHTHTFTTASAVTSISIANHGNGNTSSENMPPAIILNYIIFADV
jgi:microcystin-dependent protein